MKTQFYKKQVFKSFIFLCILGIFTLFTVGCVDDLISSPPEDNMEQALGNGLYEKHTAFYERTSKGPEKYLMQTMVGKKDQNGRFTGDITIESENYRLARWNSIEKCFFKDGVRHGKSTTTTTHLNTDGSKGSTYIETYCYDMGKRVECNKSGILSIQKSSSFQLLNYNYPWALLFFSTKTDVGGNWIAPELEAFMNTFDKKLISRKISVEKFDEIYASVFDSLVDIESNKPVGIMNTNFLIYQGKVILKNNKLRLAQIDRILNSGNSVFNVIKSKYPDYLQWIKTQNISEPDFSAFCQNLDIKMNGFGVYDLKSPFLSDTVDARLSRAMEEIQEEKSASLKSLYLFKKVFTKNTISFNAISDFQQYLMSSPKDVANVIVNGGLSEVFEKADYVRKSIKEAYYQIPVGNQNIPFEPEWNIYPNPVATLLQVRLVLQASSQFNLSVFSMDGKEVFSSKLSNLKLGINTFSFDLSALVSGTYICKISHNELIFSKKFVKE